MHGHDDHAPDLMSGGFEAAARKVAELATTTEALSGHGGAREGAGRKVAKLGPNDRVPEEEPIQVDDVNLNSKGGNKNDYLAARIKRDHPEIHEQMKAGEFNSVRQAALAAGIVNGPECASEEHLRLSTTLDRYPSKGWASKRPQVEPKPEGEKERVATKSDLGRRISDPGYFDRPGSGQNAGGLPPVAFSK